MNLFIKVGLPIAIVFSLLIGCNKQTVREPETMPQYEEAEMQPVHEQAGSEIVESPPPKPPRPERFTTIYFDYDKFDLSPEARAMLSMHAKKLEQFPDIRVLIEGHCDERGTIEYNLALGDKRANMVKDYLVNYGISTTRLPIISYGKERPAAQGHDESALAKNRRAQFVIVK